MVITPPSGSGLPEQDNELRQTAESAKEQLEEHDKGAEVLTRPLNSPDPNPIKHPWDAPEQTQSLQAQLDNSQDPKDPLPTSQCQMPQNTPRAPVFVM